MKIAWNCTLPQQVIEFAQANPQKSAICTGKTSVTYGQLLEKLTFACVNLKNIGVKESDIVLVSAVTKAEYVAAYLAVKYLGAVVVPVQRTATPEEVKYILEVTKAKFLLSDNPRYESEGKYSINLICKANPEIPAESYVLPEHSDSVESDDITEILFTSGTTGNPKGAMLSQKGIYHSVIDTATGMDMQESDILLHPLPLNHSFGLRVLRSALSVGATICLQNGFSFAKEILDAMERWNCNTMVAVNAGMEMLHQQLGEDYLKPFQNLRYIEFSAGAVPVETRKKLIQGLPNTRLFNTWGSTETGAGLFLEFSANAGKIESAGEGINGIEPAILADDGTILPKGSLDYGRLIIKTNACMSGYFANEELTSELLKGQWLYTGDTARIDDEGFVYIAGRVDDIINVGGEKVSPNRVEDIVNSCSGVVESGCIGVDDPDGVLGQVPVLYIVANNYDKAQVEEAIRSQGNVYMIPKQIIEIPEIPRNFMGKIDRKALKELWKNSANGSSLAETVDVSEIVLQNILTRRSVRSFTGEPVPQEFLEKILLAGRMAPSGHNMQTWRFTVIKNQKSIENLKSLATNVAKDTNTAIYGFLNPTVCIVVSNDVRNYAAALDSAAALENMQLMAHALGLGSVWINCLYHTCDDPRIRELLTSYGIPETHRVYGTLGLGFPQDKNVKMPAKKDANSVVFYYEEEN